jgi:hypothetical protein
VAGKKVKDDARSPSRCQFTELMAIHQVTFLKIKISPVFWD